MPDSNWSVRTTVIGAIGALALVAYGAGFFAASLPEPEYQRDATKRAASNASESPDPSSQASGVAPLPAGDVEPPPQDQSYYNREDLQAQRVMAWWTRIMGMAAAVGIFLGGVSIWLIWRTWDATREAAENSRKTLSAYIAKERAHLLVRGAKYAYLDKIPYPNCISANLENRGSSPARLLGVSWEYLDGPIWPERLRFQKSDDGVIAAGKEGPSAFLQPHTDEIAGRFLAVTVSYATVQEGPFYSHGAFEVQYVDGHGYAPGEIVAKQTFFKDMPDDT